MFTLDQLRVLSVYSKSDSFENAAQGLHRAQSAVSYAIKSLEESLGVALLDRSGYRARLTPEGEAILSKAEAVLAGAEELEHVARELREGAEPELNILINGILANGGVASAHVANNPWAGSGYRMEIYGREGTLIVSSEESPNQDGVRLRCARGGNKLEDLEIPVKFINVLEGMPRGAPYNVGQMYYKFGQAIRSGVACHPDFNTAVELHHFIDNIQQASDRGQEVAVGVR